MKQWKNDGPEQPVKSHRRIRALVILVQYVLIRMYYVYLM